MIASKMNKTFLTFDLEDFSYDMKYNHGISVDRCIRPDALWSAYNMINEFCRNVLHDDKITFFCTGVVAKYCPEIIEKIASDGHEIACHYYRHYDVKKDTLIEFEKNLRIAIDALEYSSGKKVYGFRAPKFSLCYSDIEYYRVVEKYFKYDSSVVVSSKAEVEAMNEVVKQFDLCFFPLYRYSVFFGMHLCPGGTYLKIFPLSVILDALSKCANDGIFPIVYVHPYEMLSDFSFYVTLREMVGVSVLKKIYLSVRQLQWVYLSNGQVINKLSEIFRKCEAGSTLCSLL